MTDAHSENCTKHINTLRRQNPEILNVRADGTIEELLERKSSGPG
jgi:hypothetical protein